MNLREFLQVVRHSFLLIACCAVAGAVVGASYALLRAPEYVAVSKAFVSTVGATSISDLSQGTSFSQQAVKSYADVATTPYVLGDVVRTLRLHESAEDLAERVSVTAPVDTAVLQIAASDASPRTAAAIANAVTSNLADAVVRLTPSGADSTQVKITQVQPADAPTAVAGPSLAVLVAGGLSIGLVAGLLFAGLRDLLDTRVRNLVEAEHASGLPILGAIAFDPDAVQRPLIVRDLSQSGRAEAYRGLRTNLQYLNWRTASKAIVFTSSVESEGKSTTAANLAITLVDAGQSVLLVDADLRRPRVGAYFGIEGGTGLVDVIIGRVRLEEAIQQWGDGQLRVLPSGPVPPNPSELLQSERMAELLAELTDKFDTVILDAPPLLPVSDAAILARLASGAVVMAAARRVRRPQLRAALGVLEQVNANIFGLVVTMLPRRAGAAYGYGYGAYYGGEPDAAPAATA